jgi:hypothetical protein
MLLFKNMFITTFAQKYSQNAGNAISNDTKILKIERGQPHAPRPTKKCPASG